MKNIQIKIFTSLFVVIVFMASAFYKMYNKPHVNVKQSTTDFTITTQKLLKAFITDEIQADKKFGNKIITVSGKIKEISTVNGNGVITLSDGKKTSHIICELTPEENNKFLRLKETQNIKIKGICTGFLLDVVLINCVILK